MVYNCNTIIDIHIQIYIAWPSLAARIPGRGNKGNETIGNWLNINSINRFSKKTTNRVSDNVNDRSVTNKADIAKL